jgi:hypothetical protein
VRLDEVTARKLNVVRLHSESRRQILFAQWLNADQNNTYTPLLSLNDALPQVLIPSEEVGRRDRTFSGEDNEIADDSRINALLAMGRLTSESELHAGKVPDLHLFWSRYEIAGSVIPVGP